LYASVVFNFTGSPGLTFFESSGSFSSTLIVVPLGSLAPIDSVCALAEAALD
jgi:hypothetical protein